MNAEHIATELEDTTQELLNMLSEFREDQFNAVPFEGSWTAGQVAEHLLKSEMGLPKMLNDNVQITNRAPDEKVPVIESIFLNFDTKLNAPEFIVPSAGPHEKQRMITQLREVRKNIASIAGTVDLSQTCTAAEFPGMGLLTRWEWINFVICHSKRHMHQVKNILEKVQGKA